MAQTALVLRTYYFLINGFFIKVVITIRKCASKMIEIAYASPLFGNKKDRWGWAMGGQFGSNIVPLTGTFSFFLCL